MLHDLGFMLSCRITPVRGDRDAIMAAIKRTHVRPSLAEMPKVMSEIEALDARGPLAVARDWLRRTLRRLTLRLSKGYDDLLSLDTCPTHVHFANHVLLATAESGAREAIIEFSRTSGRFHYMAAGGELTQYDIPPKWARRIIRRIAFMAKGSPEHAIPEGRIELNLCGEPFNYDVTRERTATGERIVLRLVDPPSAES
jgi:hypothetical protein